MQTNEENRGAKAYTIDVRIDRVRFDAKMGELKRSAASGALTIEAAEREVSALLEETLELACLVE